MICNCLGFLIFKVRRWEIAALCIQSSAEAPNALNLGSKRLERRTLDKYKARRREFYVHQAAAQLWADGAPFERALSVAQAAFDATTTEAS